ncbi:hypothetical protein [Thalassolituus marinus]|uniref:Ig-like domain-containing protein n=1 Tax=Thalassolituus marinus TaxID=671053 RepID=A0ABS7ZX31_9GAMM|nr:hypothetical protein [Thalassolituus marinus]MCA6064966.1 hypothetical protein [Thalassolituus marinus]
MSKSRFTLATLPLALTLAACSGGGGGGGGSDDEDDGSVVSGEPAATVEVERVSLTGLAIKGLARGAKIELFALDTTSGTFQTTALASGSTDANGQYTFDFEDRTPPSGVVKVVLSYQDGAELQCDNTNSGDDATACYSPAGYVPLGDYYSMPTGFRLVSIADFDSSAVDINGARIINLTSLSSLASSLLDEDSDSSLTYAEKVLKASAQIKAILGMNADTDLTSDTPENLAEEDDVGDQEYGALNAAFIRIAKDTNVSVDTVIGNFIDAITSTGQVGQIVWKSSDTNDKNTLAVLIDAARNLDTGADFSGIQTEIDAATPGDYTDKVPPVVTLGSNQTVAPGTSVTLTASEVQGITGKTTITYNWLTNAPGASLTSTTNTQTFTAPPTEGNYRVGVKVTDSDTGLESSTAITLTVKAPAVIGSALDGDYHLVYSARRLEKQTDGSTAYLLRGEMEDGGTFKIGTGSEGTILYEAPGFSALNHLFENNISDSNSGIYSELETYTGEGFQSKIALKSDGTASVDIPKDTELDSAEGIYSVSEGFTLRLVPVAKDNSLYLGFGVDDGREYGLLNGQPDTTNLLFDDREIMNIMLARKNGLSGTDIVKNAEYVGFELEFGTGGTSNIETSVYDVRLSFDASGALSSFEPYSVEFNGQVPSSMNLLPQPGDTNAEPGDYNFIDGRFTYDDVPTIDSAGSHGSVLLATDQSALMVQSVYWNNNLSNNATNTAFDSTIDPFWRSTSLGVFVKTPGSAINLDGKTFAIGAQGFYSVLDSQSASSFGMRGEYGTATFSGSTLTLTLTGKQVALTPDSSGTLTFAKPATASTRTVTIAVEQMTTGSDGCATIVTSSLESDTPPYNGTYACTDGKTLVMRHFSTTTDGGNTRKYLGMMVGTNVAQ